MGTLFFGIDNGRRDSTGVPFFSQLPYPFPATTDAKEPESSKSGDFQLANAGFDYVRNPTRDDRGIIDTSG